MSDHPHELPADETLAQVAIALETGRLAGELLDADWRLRYVSTELRTLVGVDDDEGLDYGAISTVRATRRPEVWRLDEESRHAWWALDGPYIRHDFSGREDSILDELGVLAKPFLRHVPEPPPAAWAGKFNTTLPDGSPVTNTRFVLRVLRADGTLAGYLGLYVGGGLRGSVQVMLSRGDDGMFERMAALTEPARRPAAILLCDLEASAVHSRRLSSRSYFELIRELTTAIDAAVIGAGGIVGKHVGDGVTSFFLAEQCGGEGRAAEGALRAALEVVGAARSMRAGDAPLAVNCGLHWGGTLVIGQVVTGGRLEVTALGDEVNAAARVQETCHGGCILATKDLLERIGADAAVELGIDPDGTSYALLAELPKASEKAIRDAGALAVAEVRAPAG